MSLNIDLQLGIDRAAEEYKEQVEKAFISKLNRIGRDLIETNENMEESASQFEMEYRGNLFSIGKVLAGLDLDSNKLPQDIETLQKMGVRFSFDYSSRPIITMDDEGHITRARISFPKIRTELMMTIGER